MNRHPSQPAEFGQIGFLKSDVAKHVQYLKESTRIEGFYSFDLIEIATLGHEPKWLNSRNRHGKIVDKRPIDPDERFFYR